MALAEGGDVLGIGATAVEVDKHQGSGLRRDSLFQEAVVYLKGVEARLNENGNQTIIGDGQNRRNKGVGRNHHFVAFMQ